MPRAEAAQLEEVLVTGDPDSGPEAADEHGHRCGCGDKLLVAFFAPDDSGNLPRAPLSLERGASGRDARGRTFNDRPRAQRRYDANPLVPRAKESLASCAGQQRLRMTSKLRSGSQVDG